MKASMNQSMIVSISMPSRAGTVSAHVLEYSILNTQYSIQMTVLCGVEYLARGTLSQGLPHLLNSTLLVPYHRDP